MCIATNGKGVHLLKVGSKRRRTAAELAEVKEEEVRNQDRVLEMEIKMAQAAELERQNRDLMERLEVQ